MLDAQMYFQTPDKSIKFSPFLQGILIFATLLFTLRENKALTCPVSLSLFICCMPPKLIYF